MEVLRAIAHNYLKNETVFREGVAGVIIERHWRVDRKTTAPAVPTYRIQFTDGRELTCAEAELTSWRQHAQS